ncbi:MAG: TIGR03618 family F420-dependent PPOX class oxidoreductase [Dehalococcoidia bacterium]
MTPEEREAFVSAPNTAILATVDSHGRAHAVPVWYLYEGGAFLVLTDRGSQKHKNVLRTGRATLCIDDRRSFKTVTAEGSVEVRDPVTYETRLRLHTHYRGEEGGKKAAANGAHERMVALILTPERWY